MQIHITAEEYLCNSDECLVNLVRDRFVQVYTANTTNTYPRDPRIDSIIEALKRGPARR